MKKILSLQSLRGICVLLVMLVHFNPYNDSFLHIPHLASGAVLIFLVLSGFIITMIYEEKICNVRSLLKFYKKRFFRMYPLHLLFLFIFLGIEFFKLYLQDNYGLISNNEAFVINNAHNFFSNLFLLNIFNSSLSYNLPAWTVSGEFLTSIFFGVICLIFQNKKSRINFLIFVLLLIATLFFFFKKKFIDYTTVFAFLAVVYCFIIGFFSLRIFNSKNFIYVLLTNNIFQIFNLILIFLFLRIDHLNILFPISCGFIIIYLTNMNDRSFIEKIFHSKFLIYTGKISYTLYISHFFVYWFYTQLFRHILEIENLNSFENSNFVYNTFIIYLFKLVLSFFTSYILSDFLYNKFEKKFI